MTLDARAPQDLTMAHFGRASAYWRDVYDEDSFQALIYRRRQEVVLDWVDALRLPAGSRILEVGCGAGRATVELARRGFSVESTDLSPEMVAQTSRRVAGEGLAERVTVRVADVHALPYPPRAFALVIALGVLPWLHAPARGVHELARVLTPGGTAIVTADNRLRLNWVLEPAESPLVVPAKHAWRALRGPGTRDAAVSRLHRPAAVDAMLVEAGLQPERRTTVGFGPFTVFWRPVLGDRLGLALDRRLGGLAETALPRLRRTGWHYVVSARRMA